MRPSTDRAPGVTVSETSSSPDAPSSSSATQIQHAGRAWYAASRSAFLGQAADAIAHDLLSAAAHSGWTIEKEQAEEWRREVDLLHQGLRGRHGAAIATLHSVLGQPEASAIEHVILEYDFRRRGLRIDAVLLAPGIVLILEFKRSNLDAASRDQVLHYAVSLVEFHEETRALTAQGVLVVPILVRTEGSQPLDTASGVGGLPAPWTSIWRQPLRCDASTLGQAVQAALALRTSDASVDPSAWLASRFDPASTIVDAAISLYGQHEVSAIREHASPVAEIQACTDAVAAHIEQARACGRSRVIFLSGAPGAGKTLVALNLAFDPRYRRDAVFVTGNAPLVEVLEAALQRSYRPSARARSALVASGYAHDSAREAIRNSTFKLVKAHRFLGKRGATTGSTDGAVVLFDEAQRTYEKGRQVAGHRLEDHEADLILQALEASYERGAVLVALLGENQAINKGERGAAAWFEAAERRGWDFAVGDRTLQLPELAADPRWHDHTSRLVLDHGHLGHSMRFYRNASVERWAHHILENDSAQAAQIAGALDAEGHTVWVTRDLARARAWARERRVGEERSGIIASSQARRLAAHGLRVDEKPDIATWMLAPTGDFRSSNTLESVQNEYQVQGLELDWTIVGWGSDLRHDGNAWGAYALSGSAWQRDKAVGVSKNRYRVLLTRARKGMVIFVPLGDASGEDPTREPKWYQRNFEWLVRCGARELA